MLKCVWSIKCWDKYFVQYLTSHSQMIFKILSNGIKCSHNFCVSVLHEENFLSGNTNTVSSSFMTYISEHYLFCIIKPDTFFLNNLRYLFQEPPSRRLIFGTLSVTVFSVSTEMISSVLLLFDFMKRTAYWCTWFFRRWTEYHFWKYWQQSTKSLSSYGRRSCDCNSTHMDMLKFLHPWSSSDTKKLHVHLSDTWTQSINRSANKKQSE